jgi:hypothetical protein
MTISFSYKGLVSVQMSSGSHRRRGCSNCCYQNNNSGLSVVEKASTSTSRYLTNPLSPLPTHPPSPTRSDSRVNPNVAAHCASIHLQTHPTSPASHPIPSHPTRPPHRHDRASRRCGIPARPTGVNHPSVSQLNSGTSGSRRLAPSFLCALSTSLHLSLGASLAPLQLASRVQTGRCRVVGW